MQQSLANDGRDHKIFMHVKTEQTDRDFSVNNDCHQTVSVSFESFLAVNVTPRIR